jgi:threonine dehydrogenase-like Zn-dependent dehydrogenase
VRQLTFVKKGVLEWREAPEPELRAPEEALVRPFVAARCDGDNLPLFNNAARLLQLGIAIHRIDPITRDVLGDPPLRGPFAFGHECVAEVVACGAEVRSVAPGDVVIVPWSISCGGCFNCAHGWTSKCGANETPIAAYGFGRSTGSWGGAMSDKLRVPFADAMLVRLPAAIDPLLAASASDNLPDGWRTVAPHLKRFPGAQVLVVGGAARSIGLYAAGIAVASGASRVDYMDADAERLRIAQELGATPVEVAGGAHWWRKHAPRHGGPYLIAVDASASVAGLTYALRSLAPGGICTGVGYYFERKGGLPLMQMYINDTTLHIGVSHPRADLPQLLALLQTGKFRPERVTTLTADWDDAPRAFLEQTTKVVVRRPRITAMSDSRKTVQ